jgi:primary-amine oxidase
VVDLPSNLPGSVTITDPVVSSWTILDGLLQPSLQPEELLWAEDVCKKDAKVKEACDAIGVDQQNIAVDGEFWWPSLGGEGKSSFRRLVHWSG